MRAKLTPELHRQQIETYTKQYPDYAAYANALKRILTQACAASLPEAFVQARAKTIPSFAEKCARKFHKYPDAVNHFTDLCGARLIVQTLDQVEAAKTFIRANFTSVAKAASVPSSTASRSVRKSSRIPSGGFMRRLPLSASISSAAMARWCGVASPLTGRPARRAARMAATEPAQETCWM